MKMKHLALLLITAALVGCTFTSCAVLKYQPDSWAGKPNPLDSLRGEPTADELHRDNVRAITSNPGYQLP